MHQESHLRGRIWWATFLFIAGLFLSGVTAMPLVAEVNWLVKITGAHGSSSAWAEWLTRVQSALIQTQTHWPFLFYGTDWLAFGHFMIALVFVGALQHPVRNRWLYDFGLMACALVIPFALVCGGARGIPLWWRGVDCGFGICGFIPLWLCRGWVERLENSPETPGRNQ